MKSISASLAAAALLAATPALAYQSAPAAPAAAAAKPVTLESTVAELIANPKADAVLRELIPDVRANEMFATAGAGMTLREIAQYEPALTDAKIKAVGEALAKAQAAP